MATYYETCAFPKPGISKKKKLYNGYKDKPGRVCRYCGEFCAERHEIFGGPNRQISMREGFQVDVCSSHHRELQDNITDWAQAENKRIKADMQQKYMDKLIDGGMDERTALKMWMNLIGRNYIDGLMPE